MAKVSARELADLVPCSPEQVDRLAELGLLTPDERGHFAATDVHVVRLMAAFEEVGISVEETDRRIYQRAGAFTEVVASIVPWLQRRHREHAVLEYLVSVTETF